ncbi:YaiO family outer membrane beta-barrel protein [Acinetobacter sp. ANC 4633]|uniref:YaiO family outer membrane beta-barrel protein n=1 Tax=Acinetobacter sp. ANC 4633 TaxID=2529845 RepID=UPI0010400ED8|nr:YaiO family outer membrane beta-barrel protein [Acinetobacter sp. ANC 4633]TCB27045.1 YaiO family outer membrane beta-barrel protein [Acinetobacter sp. ANC 4633]
MKKKFLIGTLSFLSSSSFADNQILDVNYSQENNTNHQPDWKTTELSYTQKKDENYWQVFLRNYDRYDLNDNQVEFDATDLVHENQNSKTFLSYTLGAGDFNSSSYLAEFKAGLTLQQTYKNGQTSPIIDYKYSKYENSSVNYYGLSAEKYIQNWRILAGFWVSDTSFYKPTAGVKAQISYYIPHSSNSINYYFSDGKEPEVSNVSTKIYHITSHALASKILISKNLYTNIGLTHTVYHGNYSRTGCLVGISYDF